MEMSFEETFEVAIIQFLMPDGKPQQTDTRLPREVEPLYRNMLKHDCRFETEVLRTREVSVTITNQDEDVDISITPNGPEVQAGMIDMLKRQKWDAAQQKGGK